MQTSVQRSNSIRFGSGVLYVSSDNGSSWVNLGGLRDASLSVSKAITEIVLDNAKLDPQVKIEEAVISANLYEIALDNLQMIDGLATYSTTSASAVNVEDEALGTGWTVDTPIKLSNKNGVNTEVASIVINEDGSPLTLDTDYRVFVGSYGYTYIMPIASATGVITADYTYTPLANRTQLYQDVIKTLSRNRFKFVNTDSNGKEFGIEFYEGYNRAGIEATFQPDETTDDAMNLPIEIKAFPVAGSQNLFRIFDEQDV